MSDVTVERVYSDEDLLKRTNSEHSYQGGAPPNQVSQHDTVNTSGLVVGNEHTTVEEGTGPEGLHRWTVYVRGAGGKPLSSEEAAEIECAQPSGFAGRFRNATPDHFAMFVLHRMRAKGHGSLSYVASKRIESVFEEWVEALLEEDKNAEETKD